MEIFYTHKAAKQLADLSYITQKRIIRPPAQQFFYCNFHISATTLQKLFNVYAVYAS